MADKETAMKCLMKYFSEDATEIFLYGSQVYSNTPSDTDAVVIKEGDDFALFDGELPKIGKAHIVIAGKDELYKINNRKGIPVMARPPLSSLTCPRELIYENKNNKGFYKEIYRMVSENVLEYVIPRLKITFPYEEEIEIKSSNMIRFLRGRIAPLADPKLKCGEKPKYFEKWKNQNAWKLTEGIITDMDVEAYLQKHNLPIEKRNGKSFVIKIPQNSPSIQEDRRRISEWREKKLKPAIVTEFSELF